MKTYTLRETSQIVGVTIVGLNRLINRGDLVAFQPGGEGSRMVVPADELERLQRDPKIAERLSVTAQNYPPRT